MNQLAGGQSLAHVTPKFCQIFQIISYLRTLLTGHRFILYLVLFMPIQDGLHTIPQTNAIN